MRRSLAEAEETGRCKVARSGCEEEREAASRERMIRETRSVSVLQVSRWPIEMQKSSVTKEDSSRSWNRRLPGPEIEFASVGEAHSKIDCGYIAP